MTDQNDIPLYHINNWYAMLPLDETVPVFGIVDGEKIQVGEGRATPDGLFTTKFYKDEISQAAYEFLNNLEQNDRGIVRITEMTLQTEISLDG